MVGVTGSIPVAPTILRSRSERWIPRFARAGYAWRSYTKNARTERVPRSLNEVKAKTDWPKRGISHRGTPNQRANDFRRRDVDRAVYRLDALGPDRPGAAPQKLLRLSARVRRPRSAIPARLLRPALLRQWRGGCLRPAHRRRGGWFHRTGRRRISGRAAGAVRSRRHR